MASPFVLFEIASDVATFLASLNPHHPPSGLAGVGGVGNVLSAGGVAGVGVHFPTQTAAPMYNNSHFRSPILSSVIQKCCQMFIQCAHQRLHHITTAEYDEFVGIVCSARSAFSLSPGGLVQFHELLQGLKRSRSCKKDLWARITNSLAAPTMALPGQPLPPGAAGGH